MFLQLVTGATPAETQRNADSLFIYTPLQLSAIAETVWRNRYNGATSATTPIAPFVPWAKALTDNILIPTPISGYYFDPAGINPPQPVAQGIGVMPAGEVFQPPTALPGLQPDSGGNVVPTNWDHLIYAYLIENTRIFDVFAKVLEAYMFSERLETPSPASQQFWRNTEYMLFGDGLPSVLWTTSSRQRRDEFANRLTVYYWMFGVDLSHAQELVGAHPYEKPAAANRDFIPTFEVLCVRGLARDPERQEHQRREFHRSGGDRDACAAHLRHDGDAAAQRQFVARGVPSRRPDVVAASGADV